jgi:hypothetical protein
VVRFAPVGIGEWAQALLWEKDFIESDWAALSWALGSTRILFTLPDTPFGELGVPPWPIESVSCSLRLKKGCFFG